MLDKTDSSNDQLNKELNFERKRNGKQKILNQYIEEFPDGQQDDIVKKSLKSKIDKKVLESHQQKEQIDATKQRGHKRYESFSYPCSNHEIHTETPKSTAPPQDIDIQNSRQITFSTLTKTSSILLSLLRNSQSKTKTQQFLEKTILVQKMVPEEMCKICKAEDFEKIQVLGKGAFGVVEKQLFKPLSQEVAMKKYLNRQSQEEFDSEVYIMKKKESEYIPKLIYFTKDNLQIFMELGMITLEAYENYLRRNKILFQEDYGLWILSQLLKINKHMYNEEYHHSDIKPANIIFTFNEQQEMKVKLIDFGAASTFTQDYWIQFTRLFQCPRLLNKLEFTREEILYAEFFASCRTVQLLTLANHPKRSVLFHLDSLEEYLIDEDIKKKYEYLLVVLQYLYRKRETSLTKIDIVFLEILLGTSFQIKAFEQQVEDVYQQIYYTK